MAAVRAHSFSAGFAEMWTELSLFRLCAISIMADGKLRANVRAALFRVVEGIDGSTPLPVSDANLLIDELIRKHPDYNSYKCETRDTKLAKPAVPSRRLLHLHEQSLGNLVAAARHSVGHWGAASQALHSKHVVITWSVCIPYGAPLTQIARASEQNDI
eukprot:1053-Heterococcus_DN1.PRE.2